jgi:hypothetical protein
VEGPFVSCSSKPSHLLGLFNVFIPLPFSFIIYFILLIAVAIWRISKKALSGKEAITIILLSIGFNLVTNLFIRWPFSIVVFYLVDFPAYMAYT